MGFKPMRKLFAAAFLWVIPTAAFAACAGGSQTLTFSVAPAGLSATMCLNAADLASMQAAFASPLIAAGNPSPTGAQDWAVAVGVMQGAFNAYIQQYLVGQATKTAVAGVVFTGAQ
jgi:hypothetical protein